MEFHPQALSNLCRVCPAVIKPGSQSIDAILFAKEIKDQLGNILKLMTFHSKVINKLISNCLLCFY